MSFWSEINKVQGGKKQFKLTNGSSYRVVAYTIGKSAVKRHQNSKSGPFTPRESVVSNCCTNLYGATKSHNITA